MSKLSIESTPKSGETPISVTNEKFFKDNKSESCDGLYDISHTVTAYVKNTGKVAGAEVAQVCPPPSLRLQRALTDTNVTLALPHLSRLDSQQDAYSQLTRFRKTFPSTRRVQTGHFQTEEQRSLRLVDRQTRMALA